MLEKTVDRRVHTLFWGRIEFILAVIFAYSKVMVIDKEPSFVALETRLCHTSYT